MIGIPERQTREQEEKKYLKQCAVPETGKVNASKHRIWGLFVIQHVLCKS